MGSLPTYGICHLSIVPVRSSPSDKSELCTQLLFGDAYTVLDSSEDQKWYHIEIEADSYQGWLDTSQFFEISLDYFIRYKATPKHYVMDILTYLHFQKTIFPVVSGSSLPFLEDGKVDLEGQIYQLGESNSSHKNIDFQGVMSAAALYLHAPYLWGGKSPLGIDCSGFTQIVFRLMGKSILRDAYQQAELGQLVPGIQEAQEGDLAFFVRNERIVHVGIILPQQASVWAAGDVIPGENEHFIIHAYDAVRVDKLDATGIYNQKEKRYTHTLDRIKRL